MSEKARGRVSLALAAMCWGLAGVCVKSVSWSAMSLLATRSVLAYLMFMLFNHRVKPHFSRVNVLGAAATAGTAILYVSAVKLTTSGTAIILQYIAPIWVFLFTVLFRGRKARPVELIITLAVFGGIVLSFADSLDATHVLGNILAVLSSFTMAAQILIMNDEQAEPTDSLMISFMMVFVFTVPFALGDKGISFSGESIFWVLMLGIVQYGLANTLFAHGIQKVEAVESSLLLTIEPIFNPIPVAIFCGEMMGPKAIIGSVIVIAGITAYSLLPHLGKKAEGQA